MWACLDDGSAGAQIPKLLLSAHLTLQGPDESEEANLASKAGCP